MTLHDALKGIEESRCGCCGLRYEDEHDHPVMSLSAALRALEETVEGMKGRLVCREEQGDTGAYYECPCAICDALRLADQGLRDAEKALKGER